MATEIELEALSHVYPMAVLSKCIYPDAVSCEAMLETTWLTSELGVADNNLFGMKQHAHPIFGTVNLPTKEFLDHHWVVQHDDFVKYPTMADCFADRMATLVRLAPRYPHYAAALKAATAEEFLTEVSKSWSTGPTRGKDCITILHAHRSLLR